MLSSQAIFDLINGIEKKEMAFWVDGNTGPFAIDMINGSCTGNLTKIGKEIEESGVNVLLSPVEITREGESIWLVPELNQTDIQMNYLEMTEDMFESTEDYQNVILYGQELQKWYEQLSDNGQVKIRVNHYPIQANMTQADWDGLGYLDYDLSIARLSDGQVIPAEVVVVSAGVRANTALAKEIGLDADRAVKVNERMETSVPNVYACGDCAEFNGANYAVWPEASEQGRIAGANAAGDQIEYAATAPTLTFHGMNTALFAAGDNGKNPNLLYKTAEFKDMGKGRYSKYYFLNNRLAGVIMIGDLSDMVKITEALEKHALYKDVLG